MPGFNGFAGLGTTIVKDGLKQAVLAGTAGLRGFEQAANERLPGADSRLSGQLGQIEDVANRVGEEDAVAGASARSDAQSAGDAAQFERATRGFDLTPRQKKASGRKLGLSRAVNRADAAGSVRRGFTQRQNAAEQAGGGFADAIFSQNLNTQRDLATAEVTKNASDAQRKANKRSGALGAIGTVVGSALAFFSSEDLKHDRGHEGDLLEKLKKVRVNRWQYKGDDKTHVGPFSEEFNREFEIDTDRPDMISVIDALGVTMGAIKELDKKVSAHGG
jgi:hypothetical protein